MRAVDQFSFSFLDKLVIKLCCVTPSSAAVQVKWSTSVDWSRNQLTGYETTGYNMSTHRFLLRLEEGWCAFWVTGEVFL